MNKMLFVAMIILFVSSTLIAQSTDTLNKLGSIGGPGAYEILNNSSEPIKIPFRMHYRKPLMDLEINGEKATLMIDNGVLWNQVWLFGSPLIDGLDLRPLKKAAVEGAVKGDPTQAYISTNLTLKFENIIFTEQPSFVSPPAAGFAKMFPGVDGQLSSTFFKHFIVEFNFIDNKIILHDPKQFKYNGNGSVLEMNANESGTYSVPFSLTTLNGDIYTDRVDIDFGGIYPLKIALNTKHNIKIPVDVKTKPSFGNAIEYIRKIKSMTIGNYKFGNPTTIFGDEKTSRMHPTNLGIIGLPLFIKFNIIFDYFNNKLYIEPNKYFDKPFE